MSVAGRKSALRGEITSLTRVCTIITVGFYDENIKIGRQNMINGPAAAAVAAVHRRRRCFSVYTRPRRILLLLLLYTCFGAFLLFRFFYLYTHLRVRVCR